MDVDYNKNFVGKGDPGFKYDLRKDFSRNKNAVIDDDSWDDDEWEANESTIIHKIDHWINQYALN